MLKKYVNPYTISIIALILSIMSYLDIGFNQDLIKPDNLPPTDQEINPLAFDQFINNQEISASKTLAGKISSKSGQTILDLDKDRLSFINGSRIISFGNLEDSSFGMQLTNNDNNKIISLTDLEEFIALDNNFKIKNLDSNTNLMDKNGAQPNNLILADYYQDFDLGIGRGGDETYMDIILDTGTGNENYPLNFNLTEKTIILALFTGQFDMAITSGNAIGDAAITIDDNIYQPSNQYYSDLNRVPRVTLSTYKILTLQPGNHKATIMVKRDQSPGGDTAFWMYKASLTILKLGIIF